MKTAQLNEPNQTETKLNNASYASSARKRQTTAKPIPSSRASSHDLRKTKLNQTTYIHVRQCCLAHAAPCAYPVSRVQRLHAHGRLHRGTRPEAHTRTRTHECVRACVPVGARACACARVRCADSARGGPQQGLGHALEGASWSERSPWQVIEIHPDAGLSAARRWRAADPG